MTEYIYLIENPLMCWYKIGFSYRAEVRFAHLRGEWDQDDARNAYLVACMPGTMALERSIHRRAREHRLGSLGREYYEMVPEVSRLFFDAGPRWCWFVDADTAEVAWHECIEQGGE